MSDFVRIRFVKQHWPFVFDSIAILKKREGDWFVNAGYAVKMDLRPVDAPAVEKAAEVIVDDIMPPVTFAPKLSTRGRKRGTHK